MTGMRIAWFGSSLLSAYWNGAATYYRGIIRALHARGHRITFYEPDAFDRQQHRDMDEPAWARVHVYQPDHAGVMRALADARGADLVVKASGVGVLDGFLEAAVLDLQRPGTMVAFWDVDAPATLDRVQQDVLDPFCSFIPRYDLVLTYGGGAPVVRAYEALGARRCVPIYNALDPATHYPAAPRDAYQGALGFLGNRLPDREARVRAFFLAAAEQMPAERFVLGGNGWDEHLLPANVAYLGHVYTRDHNAFNASPRAVLNVNRESMARYGFSPPTRVFEAAGVGACLITDAWEGIEQFLTPGEEVLVAHGGDEVARHLQALTDARARDIGARARARILSQHTYDHRAADVERALGITAGRGRSPVTGGVIGGAGGGARERDSEGDSQGGSGGDHGGVGAAGPPVADTRLDIVILGLSITSSWGNGHATTYRSLIRALCARGHRVLFLERDMPWYADNRDLPEPPHGRTVLYESRDELARRHRDAIAGADLVIVGSYVPEGALVGEWVTDVARGLTAFYDIDTPVTMAALDAGTCTYLSPALVSRYDLYLSFTGGPILNRIERTYGAARARPLYCGVDPDLYTPAFAARPRTEQPRTDLGYMGTYSHDRQPRLRDLLLTPAQRWPAGRFVVAGPQYPSDFAWPANVARIEHLPPAEHARFYTSARFTLNITRQDMVRAGFAPSVRLFEAAACGVPIISDAWTGLETFFDIGREILVARSPEDVLRCLQQMPEEERRAIGARARARVLAEHTAAHRAETLERFAREAAQAARAPRPRGRRSTPAPDRASCRIDTCAQPISREP